ncbi:MAG TPA: GAF domain-containing sensor histidine kinase, partial [Bryobacteraceae bacterium]|nr:GAF domain-containing sensor histidine kinase [Bryobacteraceae bacterium]
MSSPEKQILANAAHVLSRRVQMQLNRLAKLIVPHASAVDPRFRKYLKTLHLDARQIASLTEITPGAAARLLTHGETPARFFETVACAGRRLARLNVGPALVLDAVKEYDRMLEPLLSRSPQAQTADGRWVREQLQFCIVLSLTSAYYEVRDAESNAFQQVLAIELEASEPEAIYERFLAAMVALSRAEAARLYLFDSRRRTLHTAADARAGYPRADIPVSAASRRRLARPFVATGSAKELVLDPHWARTYAAIWSVPFGRGEDTRGVMQFGFSREHELLPRDEALLAAAAERCVLAADRARLIRDLQQREAKLKELAEHTLHAEEMERRRISRELHDDAGQSLVCMRLQLEMAEADIPPEFAALRQQLGEIREITEKTILEIRRLIADLSPAVLEQLGLAAAVRQLVNRFRKAYPCRVALNIGELPQVPGNLQIVTYRLLQECCNNVAKHSSASHVNISLTSADGVLKLTVRDDGVGFRPEEALAKYKSFGLAGMRERVALLGG